jgi:hypothetical protein
MNDTQSFTADAVSLDRLALQKTLQAQGVDWYERLMTTCVHLFADVPVFIRPEQLQQMTDIITSIEHVVNSNLWHQVVESPVSRDCAALGVFYGYDFHLNSSGAHLIEINTNAGGAFLNALLIDSQREVDLPGKNVAEAELNQVFIDMFRAEWHLQRKAAPLSCIAIIDEKPEEQYLYPEFLLAQQLFERAGIHTLIADPSECRLCADGLYIKDHKIDMIYNRLTDFSLQQHTVLLQAYQRDNVVLTPNPAHYKQYADKRNLTHLTDAELLRSIRISEADIMTLQTGIPHTFAVRPDLESMLWSERRHLFFKPCSGYGSRGAYRGEKLTRRVFGEILQSDYVAQKISPPGECRINGEILKYDVRCYVYHGSIQLLAARLYQGQTTNFRTQGGGFALVRVTT